jgi:hypothetical protein
MDILIKLPSMAEDALATLKLNAEHWERAGTSAQQNAAANLLPSLNAELATRQATKLAKSAAAAAPKKRKPSVKKVQED